MSVVTIDFNQPLPGFSGDPQTQAISEDDKKAGKEPKKYTLKDAALTSLRTALKSDNELGPMQKYELGILGVAVAKDMSLTYEQVKLLRDRIGEAFITSETIYGAWTVLDAYLKPADKLASSKPADPKKRR